MQVYSTPIDALEELCSQKRIQSLSSALEVLGSYNKLYIYTWPDDSIIIETANITYTSIHPFLVYGSLLDKCRDVLSSVKDRISLPDRLILENEGLFIYLYTPLPYRGEKKLDIDGLSFSILSPKTSVSRSGGLLPHPSSEWLYRIGTERDDTDTISLPKVSRTVHPYLENIVEKEFRC